MRTTNSHRDYTELVRTDRVDSSIFTDQAIFESEVERIFESSWVYVAHESEVPHRGDYVTRLVGRQPVIVVRAADGVRILLNRCRHRGTALCNVDAGNAKFFRCPYHGWTYDNDGHLVGVPYPTAYGETFDRDELGLTPVPRTAEHRGFIFANLSTTSQPLTDWLGPRVCQVIDSFVDASPESRITVRSGLHKTAFRGNWKYVGMDGYHVNFTHKSLVAIAEHSGVSVGADHFDERSPGRAWDFGNGHCRLQRPRDQDDFDRVLTATRKLPGGEEYVARLELTWGDRTGEILAYANDPHLGVWPNLQLIGTHIRMIRPVAPDLTEVTLYSTTLAGAPDAVNEARLRGHERAYGPAGFIQPDDSELFERNQLGLQARLDPWIYLARGLDRDVIHPDGAISGQITDETTQRGQMRMWLRQMTHPAEIDSGGHDR